MANTTNNVGRISQVIGAVVQLFKLRPGRHAQ